MKQGFSVACTFINKELLISQSRQLIWMLLGHGRCEHILLQFVAAVNVRHFSCRIRNITKGHWPSGTIWNDLCTTLYTQMPYIDIGVFYVYVCVCVCLCWSVFFVCFLMCLFVCLFICLFVWLFIHLFVFCSFVWSFVCLSSFFCINSARSFGRSMFCFICTQRNRCSAYVWARD